MQFNATFEHLSLLLRRKRSSYLRSLSKTIFRKLPILGESQLRLKQFAAYISRSETCDARVSLSAGLQGTLIGTITTDITGSIAGFDLTYRSGIITAPFNSSSGGTVTLTGNGFSSSPTQLVYNFSTAGHLLFQQGSAFADFCATPCTHIGTFSGKFFGASGSLDSTRVDSGSMVIATVNLHNTFVSSFNTALTSYLSPNSTSSAQLIQNQQLELGIANSTIAVGQNVGILTQSDALVVRYQDVLEVVSDFYALLDVLHGVPDPFQFFIIPSCSIPTNCLLPITNDRIITGSKYDLSDWELPITVSNADLPFFHTGDAYVINSSVLGDVPSISRLEVESINGNLVTLLVDNISDVSAVPGPSVGAGAPGLILGIGILVIAWQRRRKGRSQLMWGQWRGVFASKA